MEGGPFRHRNVRAGGKEPTDAGFPLFHRSMVHPSTALRRLRRSTMVLLAPKQLYPSGDEQVSSCFITLSTGVTVRIAESGPKDGVAALLLHGWGGSLYMFRHGLERLPAFGIRSIAVDLRGYGLSDKPVRRGAYTLDAYCADVDALLDALELPRVALIGQSMGGGIALQYAASRPHRVTRLALINPIGLVPVAYALLVRSAPRFLSSIAGRRMVPRSLIALILRRIAYGDASHVTERDVDEYWAPTQLAGYVYAAHGCLREFEWGPLRPAQTVKIASPAAVILGTADRLVRRAEAAAARLPGATVHVLDGGHCVHEEDPDVVYGIIGRHIH